MQLPVLHWRDLVGKIGPSAGSEEKSCKSRRTVYVAPLERQNGAHMSYYASGDVPQASVDSDVSELLASQSSDLVQAGMMLSLIHI